MRTVIVVYVDDQRLELTTTPTVASGGVGETAIEFNFSQEWAGFEKIAVFYVTENEEYHIPLVNDICTIPHEVLAKEGSFYFGIYGDLNGTVKTTDILCYKVSRGSFDGNKIASSSPNIYTAILTRLDALEKAPKISVNGVKADENGEIKIEVGSEQLQADFSQNDPTQPDYIKNRTHYTEVVEVLETVLLPETSFTTNEDGQVLYPDSIPDVEVGKEYTVTWNGVEYVTLAQGMEEDCVTMPVLGNFGAMTGGTDTGEPFIIAVIPADMAGEVGAGAMIMPMDGSTELTVSIKGAGGITETVHQLDPKFIPDMYYEKTEHTVIYSGAPTATDGVFAAKIIPLTTGQTYTVNWNGADHVYEAANGEYIGFEIVYVGNPKDCGGVDNGEPFVIFSFPDGTEGLGDLNAIFVPYDDSTSVTAKISGDIVILKQIDPKYIPDTVATVEYVNEQITETKEYTDEQISETNKYVDNLVLDSKTYSLKMKNYKLQISSGRVRTVGVMRGSLYAVPVNESINILRCDNGIVWTRPVESRTNFIAACNALCSNGSNVEVAVGETSSAAYRKAENSLTPWTVVTLPVDMVYTSICYGNGKFVAVGESNSAVYSEDGATWTAVTLPVDMVYREICYGNGKFVAVGESNSAVYSEDGATWTAVTLPVDMVYTSICYGNGKFVAVGSLTYAVYSEDGATWTSASFTNYNEDKIYSDTISLKICSNGTRFVIAAIGGYSYFTMYSDDAVTWKEGALFDRWNISLTAFNGRFMKVSRDGEVMHSSDGETWVYKNITTFVNGFDNDVTVELIDLLKSLM